jgi:hypothetical protein
MVRPKGLRPLLDIGYLFLCVAQLATISESGGNPEFWQDIGLQENPAPDNQKENPDTTHISPPSWFFFLLQLGLQIKPRCQMQPPAARNQAQENPPLEAQEG